MAIVKVNVDGVILELDEKVDANKALIKKINAAVDKQLEERFMDKREEIRKAIMEAVTPFLTSEYADADGATGFDIFNGYTIFFSMNASRVHEAALVNTKKHKIMQRIITQKIEEGNE